MSDLVNMGNGVAVPKEALDSITAAATGYYDHYENLAKSRFTDQAQLAYFERWLKGKEYSPDPKCENFDRDYREVYDAIVDLAMVGCG